MMVGHISHAAKTFGSHLVERLARWSAAAQWCRRIARARTVRTLQALDDRAPYETGVARGNIREYATRIKDGEVSG